MKCEYTCICKTFDQCSGEEPHCIYTRLTFSDITVTFIQFVVYYMKLVFYNHTIIHSSLQCITITNACSDIS